MQVKPVRLKTAAKADLVSMWRYTLGQFGERQADRYYASLVEAFAKIGSGQIQGLPYQARKLYLKYRVGRHFIFYENCGSDYEVKRILHQRMNLDQRL